MKGHSQTGGIYLTDSQDNENEDNNKKSVLSENQSLNHGKNPVEKDEPDSEGTLESKLIGEINRLKNHVLQKIEPLLKEREKQEEFLENVKKEKFTEIEKEAEKNFEILEENLKKDTEMVEKLRKKKTDEISSKIESKTGLHGLWDELKKLVGKRKEIETDISNMTTEFKEKYGAPVFKDLENVRSKINVLEKKIENKKKSVREKLPGVLKEELSRGMLGKGKVENVFREETQRIDQRIKKQKLDCVRDINHKTHETFQKYLSSLGRLSDEAEGQLRELTGKLTNDKKTVAKEVRELCEAINQVSRVRRKCALDIQKSIKSKKTDTMEKKLSEREEQISREKEKNNKLASEIESIRNSLKEKEQEITDLKNSQSKWKEKYSRELKKKLTKELTQRLEIEIRNKLKDEYEEKIEKIRETKKGKPENKPREPTISFVRCPSCTTKISVENSERPLVVSCPGCGTEYTLRDKVGNSNNQKVNPEKEANALPGVENNKNFGRKNNYNKPTQKTRMTNSTGGTFENNRNTNKTQTKEISCPHCGAVHNVPVDMKRRLTCSCGRRIRTK